MKVFLSFLIFCSLSSLMMCTVNRCYNLDQKPLWQFWQFDETTLKWVRVTDKDETVCKHCFYNNNNGDCTYKWLITNETQKNYQERCFCNFGTSDPFQDLLDRVIALEKLIAQINITELVYQDDLIPYITKADAEDEFPKKSDLDDFLKADDLTPYAKQADLDDTNNKLYDLVNILSKNPTEECDEAVKANVILDDDITLLSPPPV